MKPWIIAALLAFAAGLLAGLGWQGHRAQQAEDRAHRADSLYRETKASEVQAKRERAEAWAVRDVAQRRLDSTTAAQAESLTVVQSRATHTQAKLAAAESAAAKECPESCVRYRELYTETSDQYRSLLSITVQQQRALADLRALAVTDSASIRREERRGDRWMATADSLALANADLLKHRRAAFDVKLGIGGAAVGAVAVGAVCLLTPAC